MDKVFLKSCLSIFLPFLKIRCIVVFQTPKYRWFFKLYRYKLIN
jgi:hypothetical protein